MGAVSELNKLRSKLENELKQLVKDKYTIEYTFDGEEGKKDFYELPLEFYICDSHAECFRIYQVVNNNGQLTYWGLSELEPNETPYAFEWVETSVIAEMIDYIKNLS